jgi:hypothetical protein
MAHDVTKLIPSNGSLDSRLEVLDPETGEYSEPKPGLIPRGFAEQMLAEVTPITDIEFLWKRGAQLAAFAQLWNGHGQEKAEVKSAQMFSEITLGQLLGPNTGHPPGVKQTYPHADILPVQRVEEFRRYYGWRDELIDAVRNGARSRRSRFSGRAR